jgi:hypothetical protein
MMDNSTVRAWKAYTVTASGTGPVQAIDIEDVVNAGRVVASWEGSFSCCDTTLCSDCTIW